MNVYVRMYWHDNMILLEVFFCFSVRLASQARKIESWETVGRFCVHDIVYTEWYLAYS